MPSIQRAVAGELAVTVADVVIGSVLEVRIGGLTLGSVVATDHVVAVGTSLPLVAGEAVVPVMRVCGEVITGDEHLVDARQAVTFRRFNGYGIHNGNGNWNGGRVEGIIPVGGGRAVLVTERAGIWVLEPNGALQTLSDGWTSTQMRCARADSATPGRYFAGTDDGLYVSDPAAADPATTWNWVPGAAGHTVNDVLVLPGHDIVLLAAEDGVHVAPMTGAAALTFTAADPALLTGRFLSLTVGPDESVVAFGPSKLAVDRWSGTALTWTDRTFGGSGTTDSRLTTIASQMTNGALDSCAANRSRVYLAVARSGPDNWFPVVRSDDGGWTWTIPANDDLVVSDPPLPGNIVGLGELMGLTQGGRNLAIAAHPSIEDTVIVAGRRGGVLGSTDGATSWDTGRWPERNEWDFHSDTLCITFDTSSPPGLWAGGDGGVFSSPDLGATWTDHNQSFPTLMFDTYGLGPGVSLGVRQADPPVVVGGLQDNGLVWSRTEGEPWASIAGSDGKRVLWVGDDHVLVLTNVSKGIWLLHWNGAGLDNLGTLNPPDVPVGTNDPVIAPVLHPTMRIGGKLLAGRPRGQRGPPRSVGVPRRRPGQERTRPLPLGADWLGGRQCEGAGELGRRHRHRHQHNHARRTRSALRYRRKAGLRLRDARACLGGSGDQADVPRLRRPQLLRARRRST